MKREKKRSTGWVKQTEWIAAAVGLLLAYNAPGGVPLNNLQGIGGVAFNPLAYPAGSSGEASAETSWPEWLGRPQFGAWYVNLGDVKVDWTAIGGAITLIDRGEVSYGHEVIAIKGGENIRKDNIGAKLLLIPENAGDHGWLPAISVGAVRKSTNFSSATNDVGTDYYAVATKFITQLPLPVLASGGVLSSKEQVTGVFGFNEQRDTTFFANLDLLVLPNLALGVEYKQGSSYRTYRNADYWNLHAAWFANDHLTLVAAYVHAGNENSTSRVGLGEGVVFAVHYAF